MTAALGVDRPRTPTRPRARVAAMVGFAALLVLWSLVIGVPNDTGGVVLWVWLATIAWNIDAPRGEHLDFGGTGGGPCWYWSSTGSARPG